MTASQILQARLAAQMLGISSDTILPRVEVSPFVATLSDFLGHEDQVIWDGRKTQEVTNSAAGTFFYNFSPGQSGLFLLDLTISYNGTTAQNFANIQIVQRPGTSGLDLSYRWVRSSYEVKWREILNVRSTADTGAQFLVSFQAAAVTDFLEYTFRFKQLTAE